MKGIASEIDHAVTENKSVMLMGDFNINYLHPLEKAKLDTFLSPYDLNVLNNGDATKTTNKTHSVVHYFIGDSFVEVISCFKDNSCFKSDHKAVFLVLNNNIFWKPSLQ